jgi:hypothetical protein
MSEACFPWIWVLRRTVIESPLNCQRTRAGVLDSLTLRVLNLAYIEMRPPSIHFMLYCGFFPPWVSYCLFWGVPDMLFEAFIAIAQKSRTP